ncbi:MAG: alkaline phosphatase family protein [Acidobacteria bacterium]|nr:alkaline phosphatase family protein [Acidobacteriota bacterium]
MTKHSRLRGRLLLSLCFTLAFANLLSISSASAQQRRPSTHNSPTTAQNSGKKVRLVVGIVIDQFRYDYLARFEDLFVDGGFKRLLNHGAVFANANYVHTPTYTACGHATFMSGATPALNGIIGNEWFERETSKRVTSVSDDSVKLLGGREGVSGMSPSRLLGSTIGDELKLASIGQSKVVGISLKDRSAILPAGKRPNAAYWYDANTGNLVSSTYYFNDMPAWAKKFNHEQRPDRFFGKRWEKLLPEPAYQRSTADDASYEKGTLGNKFPYTITGGEESPGPRFYTQFESTPFANDYLVDFAKAAIENEKLGTDDNTDLLTISFSSNDLIGHAYGPYSQEVQDVTLRTDRLLAEFVNYLDLKIGLDRVIIALTADHGVAPVPEQVREPGYGGRVDPKAVTEAIEATLDQRFENEKWVLSFVNGNVYLDESAIEKRKIAAEEVERVACKAVMKIPGIDSCFTRSQLVSGGLPPTMIARSVANGFHPKRNGNLVIVPQPFYFFGEGLATTHGSPYSYDTHVPVIFFGSRIAPGVYYNACSPADIAPTLAALLKIETPSNSTGRILSEAIKMRN